MALQDIVKKGSTDRSVPMYAFDNTTGLAKTDLAYNSSGIDLWYRREGAAKTSITEATLSALTDAHSDGGFLAVGDGEYRLDLPDAAFATGANYVDYGGTATGFTLVGGRVRLVNIDLEDTVRAGLTALPNAAAEAAGGLYTRGTGAGQINQAANGQVDANVTHAAGTAWGSGAITAASIATGAIDADALAADAGAEIAAAVLTVAQTESYRADGATGTVVQMLYEILAHLGESSISGTTKTIKQINGSTTAATFTLNDATTPTSITRAT